MAGRGRVACRFFAAAGSCPYGPRCHFLHATRDTSAPLSYRTNPTREFFGVSSEPQNSSAELSAMAPGPPREASASPAHMASAPDSGARPPLPPARPPLLLPTSGLSPRELTLRSGRAPGAAASPGKAPQSSLRPQKFGTLFRGAPEQGQKAGSEQAQGGRAQGRGRQGRGELLFLAQC